MFKNAFSFNGRIKRTEYAISFIIYIIVYVFVRIMIKGADPHPAYAILFIPSVWLLWAQGAKRCHDINKSGWWQLIPFYCLVLIFKEGDQYTNQYDIGSDLIYGAEDYERPFDINEPTQGPVITTPVNDIIPPTANE